MKSKTEEILAKVRRIEITTRRVVDSILSGQYHTRFKGHGMQFSDFREYYLGDDIRHIDWKVTARTQAAHIKQFEEERDLTVYIALDMSASGDFGSAQKTKRDALAEVCAILAFAAVQNNDRVGLILFTDRVEKHIAPKKGRTHAMRLLAEILGFEPSSRKTDLGSALEFYNKVAKHTAVLFLASDFYDMGFDPALRRVSKRHDVIALRVMDRGEQKFSSLGIVELSDSESGDVFTIDTSSYVFSQNREKDFQALQRLSDQLLGRSSVSVVDVWTDEDYIARIAAFFKERRRRGRRK